MPKNSNPLTKQSSVSTNIILTVVVILVAVLVIGGILFFNRGGGGADGDDAVPADVLRNENSNVLTEAPNDKVTVTEFLDYQCDACHQYYEGLTKQIEEDYDGKVTFVTRNFPMEDMHPLAQPSAQVAEAAALQGKYKEMYHQLFDNYDDWATGPDGRPSDNREQAQQQFTQYAENIDLDMGKFRQDLDSDEVNERIDQDVSDAEQAGVQGTPTLFINGEEFQPSGDTYEDLQQEFRAKLDEELQQ